jgi:hypothetical protein
MKKIISSNIDLTAMNEYLRENHRQYNPGLKRVRSDLDTQLKRCFNNYCDYNGVHPNITSDAWTIRLYDFLFNIKY